MTITIIGLGLIGGSMALSLRGFQTHIIGVDNDEQNAKDALELALVDQILPLKNAVSVADLVIIAVPVNVIYTLLPQVLDLIPASATVVDVGSTKKSICEVVSNHPKRANFVASHPISGTENSGAKAAFATLFTGKTTIICEKELSAEFALKTVEKMYHLLNMKIVYADAISHDLHISYVSHLTHVIAFTLGLTVLEIEKDEKQIFTMAGSGFASTARIAKSHANMWLPIFQENAENLTDALDSYIKNLQKIREMIANKDAKGTHEFISQANKIRPILEGLSNPVK